MFRKRICWDHTVSVPVLRPAGTNYLEKGNCYLDDASNSDFAMGIPHNHLTQSKTHFSRVAFSLLIVGWVLPSLLPSASSAQSADSLDLQPNHFVHAFAVQSDGRVLMGGAFTNLLGETRHRIARLQSS